MLSPFPISETGKRVCVQNSEQQRLFSFPSVFRIQINVDIRSVTRAEMNMLGSVVEEILASFINNALTYSIYTYIDIFLN